MRGSAHVTGHVGQYLTCVSLSWIMQKLVRNFCRVGVYCCKVCVSTGYLCDCIRRDGLSDAHYHFLVHTVDTVWFSDSERDVSSQLQMGIR